MFYYFNFFIGKREIELKRDVSDLKKKLFDCLENDIVNPNSYHDDPELYYTFISLLGKKVVRDVAFKSNIPHNSKHFDKWFNPRDEALAFLLLENGLERWKAEIEAQKEVDKEDCWNVKLSKSEEKHLPPYRFTQRSLDQDEDDIGKGLINDSWGLEGISQYRILLNECAAFRKKKEFKVFADQVIELATKDNGMQVLRKRKMISDNINEEIKRTKELRDLFSESDMIYHFPQLVGEESVTRV